MGGTLQVGQLREVHRCPSMNYEDALHRRNQSSELILQPMGIKIDRPSGVLRTRKCYGKGLLVCQPCHWVCSLPAGRTTVHPGDGPNRLAAIAETVGPAAVSRELRETLLDLAAQARALTAMCKPATMCRVDPATMCWVMLPTTGCANFRLVTAVPTSVAPPHMS